MILPTASECLVTRLQPHEIRLHWVANLSAPFSKLPQSGPMLGDGHGQLTSEKTPPDIFHKS